MKLPIIKCNINPLLILHNSLLKDAKIAYVGIQEKRKKYEQINSYRRRINNNYIYIIKKKKKKKWHEITKTMLAVYSLLWSGWIIAF